MEDKKNQYLTVDEFAQTIAKNVTEGFEAVNRILDGFEMRLKTMEVMFERTMSSLEAAIDSAPKIN